MKRLFRTEWQKLMRRPAFPILLLIFLLFVPGMGIFLNSQSLPAPAPTPNTADAAEVEKLKGSLENAREKLRSLQTEAALGADVYGEIFAARQEVIFFETAVEMRLPVWEREYISNTLFEFAALRATIDGTSDKTEVQAEEKTAKRLQKILEERDYGAYLAWQTETKELSGEELLSEQKKNNWLAALDPHGTGESFSLRRLLEEWDRIEKSLLSDTDIYHGTGEKLTAECRGRLAGRQKLLEARLDGGLLDDSTFADSFLNLLEQAGLFGMTPLLFFAASALLTGERENGSLWGLLCAPLSRRKIIFSKIGTLSALSFVLVLLNALLTVLMSVLFFRGSMLPAPVLFGNTVVTVPFVVFVFLTAFLRFLPLFFSLALAVFLAVCGTSGTLAALPSLGLLWGGEIVNTALGLLGKPARFLAFLPFRHYSLDETLLSGVSALAATPPLPFALSFAVLFGGALLLFALAAAVFCRKDFA